MPTPANILHLDQPTVALIGRVNVGKSTLFNRLLEKNKAIISDIAGTTRTSNVGNVVWRGTDFTLIDTGGLTLQKDIPLEEDIIRQSEMAIARADVIVFVTDGSNTILPQEREIATILRKTNKPILLVANKIDTTQKEHALDIGAWLRLGLGEPLCISATSGRSIGNFLDLIYDTFETIDLKPGEEFLPDNLVTISLVGKPNVGKSSLFNKLIGQDEVIVSDLPHTTREPHDTMVTYTHVPEESDADENDTVVVSDSSELALSETDEEVEAAKNEPIEYNMNFVDTAGIRRKNKVAGFLENAGIGKSIMQIDRTDLVLLVIDASEPISTQDKQLGGLLEKRSKSVIILINKWDLSDDNSEEKRKEVIALIRSHFPHLDFAPILFVSGLTGYRVHQIFPMIVKVWKARQTYLANRAVEKFLDKAIRRRLPSRGRGSNHPKLLGMRQLNSAPPIFELYIKNKTSLHRSYLNYLENRLREQFDFTGTPIVIKMTKIKR